MATFHNAALATALLLAWTAAGHTQPTQRGTADWLADRARRAPPSSLVDFVELQGRWRVAGVAVLPSAAQAFVADDPAYLGRVMDVSRDLLRWAAGGRPAGAATLSDRCRAPATARLPPRAAAQAAREMRAPLAALGVDRPASVDNGHEVACLDGGTWGPEAAGGSILFPVARDVMALTWYDGVILRLERARPATPGAAPR